jgi:hypothetical protein
MRLTGMVGPVKTNLGIIAALSIDQSKRLEAGRDFGKNSFEREANP